MLLAVTVIAVIITTLYGFLKSGWLDTDRIMMWFPLVRWLAHGSPLKKRTARDTNRFLAYTEAELKGGVNRVRCRSPRNYSWFTFICFIQATTEDSTMTSGCQPRIAKLCFSRHDSLFKTSGKDNKNGAAEWYVARYYSKKRRNLIDCGKGANLFSEIIAVIKLLALYRWNRDFINYKVIRLLFQKLDCSFFFFLLLENEKYAQT